MYYLSILLLYFLLQGECYIHSNQCAKLLILWRIHKLPLRLPAPAHSTLKCNSLDKKTASAQGAHWLYDPKVVY